MSVRTFLTVFLALAFGVSAAVLVNSSLRAGAPSDAVDVVIAAGDVEPGSLIAPEQVTTAKFPPDRMPPGAITKKDDAVDRAALGPIIRGEAILEGKLAPRGAGRGLSATIPEGMRAFTIQTPNVATGVAGFILPGNKVDVLLTIVGDANDGTGGGSTTTLLQNVKILAVDQRIDAPANNKMDATQLRSVTLLVTPDQAAKLNLGQNRGLLHLSLRNPKDTQPSNTRPTTMLGLRFLQEKPWDERAKGVIEALGKALAQRNPEPPAPAAVPSPSFPPPRVSIRTLRGQYESRVEVEVPR